MKKLLLVPGLLPLALTAQINVTLDIRTDENIQPISPYIYGMCNGGYDDATVRRIGGNRMTGYNWENNASNAGEDYFHQSDNYMPWSMGIPSVLYNQPGIVLTAFQDSALAHQSMAAITLPMAGYVARDKNGTTVETWEEAPSSRWDAVVNHKPGPFSLTPDLNDQTVYVDEEINFLINQFGNAGSPNGIKAYIMDNEPGLWTSTHPRLYTGGINCTDHLNKSLALARTIREMDAQAQIWGPEAYGYSEYLNFQGAADWSLYSGQYSHYLGLYLDSMQHASAAAGSRLLDVMTVHWYPDVHAGPVYSTNTSPAIAWERMQVPRSLWDSTYIEYSWIGEWFSGDLPIVPKLRELITTYYPGTKLGITEYDYGAGDHISGGIAQVEALGAFARTGTEYATKWGAFGSYSRSAIQLYRNTTYPFGNQFVHSNSSDRTHSNVFASISDNDDSELHIIITNKSLDSTVTALFTIDASAAYDSLYLFSFTNGNPVIQSQALPSALLQPGGFTYTLQPLTAYHFVLRRAESTNALNELQGGDWTIAPNPASDQLNIQWKEPVSGIIRITDAQGSEVGSFRLHEPVKSYAADISRLAPGTYFLHTGSSQKLFLKN